MKYGLKLWSTNTGQYLQEALKLYDAKLFDYIELYFVPDSIHTLKHWRETRIPIALHAPHHIHGVNLAVCDKFEHNKKIFDDVKKFESELNALYTVVHLGNSGNVEESVRQLKRMELEKLVIENKPYIAPLDTSIVCQGATFEEISYALDALLCKFCLDVGHSMCTANYFNLDPYEYTKSFLKLNPFVCHLSDNDEASFLDAHYNIGHGTYDFCKISNMTRSIHYFLLETKKNSPHNLDDFQRDLKMIRGFYNA